MAVEREIKRKIDKFLMEWKLSENHLPLIVRGARQIGKTYSIRNKITFDSQKDFDLIKEIIEKEFEDYTPEYLVNRFFQSVSMISYEKKSISFMDKANASRSQKIKKMPIGLFSLIRNLKFDFISKDEDGRGVAGHAENGHVFITKDFCKEGALEFDNSFLSEKLKKINEKPGLIFFKMRKNNGDCALVSAFEENRIKLNIAEIKITDTPHCIPAYIYPSENIVTEYSSIESLLSAGWNYNGYIDLDAVNPQLAEFLKDPGMREKIKTIVSQLPSREQKAAKYRYGFNGIEVTNEDDGFDSWWEMMPERIVEWNMQLDKKVLRSLRKANGLRKYIGGPK